MSSHADRVFMEPADGIRGEFTVPGDKSISHRAIILSSIADGSSSITGLLEGEDNLRTIAAFRSMGVNIERTAPGEYVIGGAGLNGLSEPGDVVYAGNSGTTARLLTGLLSAQNFFSIISGDPSLNSRPMWRVVAPLINMGADILGRRSAQYLPLSINGRLLKGIRYKSPVASAQVKSALLLAGLYADGETVVEEPALSRDHTERIFKAFGADIESRGRMVCVRPSSRLTATDINVPGDISSAAFFMVAASVTPNSEILIRNVGINPSRCGVMDILKAMGANIETVNIHEGSEPRADIAVKSAVLKGIDITGDALLPAIDEFPVLCVAAALAEGVTRISGAAELRVKESDRISVMSGMLVKMGVLVEEKEDGVVINGTKTLKSCIIDSEGDHRIAMAAVVASLRSDCGVQVERAASVDVSFPGYFDLMRKVTV